MMRLDENDELLMRSDGDFLFWCFYLLLFIVLHSFQSCLSLKFHYGFIPFYSISNEEPQDFHKKRKKIFLGKI